MELKVWVEGIQRIVCGVTDSTTCQDVVFALAHATGKVGRFTLIERWRNNERLLAPHEYPLKILMKWGEYSNDVQFILQRSDSSLKANAQPGSSPPNANIVKVASGSTNRSPSSQSGNSNDANAHDRFKDPRKNFALGSTSVPHVSDGTLSPSKEITSSPSHGHSGNHLVGIVRGIPQNKVLGNVKLIPANVRKDVPPYREPPPPYRSPPPPTTSPPGAKAANQSQPASNSLPSQSQIFPKLNQPSQQSSAPIQPMDISGKFEPTNNNIGNSEPVVYNQQYKELVSLVNYQREKLTCQQADLTKFDAEIGYWEAKGREQERQAELLQQQIGTTDTQLRVNTEQVQALTYLEDENEVVKQAEKTLKSEMTLVRSKLANCETELLQCKNKIRKLIEEIHSEQRATNRTHEINRQQLERSLLAEIERLQNEIQQAKHATEMNHMTAETLKREVGQLETTIMEKKRQVEQLVNEMKEANLQSLAGSTDEIRCLLEGSGKQGSTRRIIGSPRQLENAVPTNKNPHGVWV